MPKNNTGMENYNFDKMLKKPGNEGRLYREFILRVEKPLIEWSLKRAWGNQIKAAKILGLNRNTIRSKIKRLDIDPRRYK